MNRPQHYAEAERLIGVVGELMSHAAASSVAPDIQARTIASANAAAAQAQVHATLAQVDYLREIANQLDTLPRSPDWGRSE